MYGKAQSIRNDLKKVERRIGTLREHIKQAEIYRKYKRKKARAKTETALFQAAQKYLIDHLNGHKLDLDTWKVELGTKTTEQEVLYREYDALKDETREVEIIKRAIEDIIREETRNTRSVPAREMEI
jgi:L-fucose isomerase-like protein